MPYVNFRWTSPIDALLRVAILFSTMVSIFAVGQILATAAAYVFPTISTGSQELVAICAALVLIGVMLSLLPRGYDASVAALSSWLYALIALSTWLPWRDAEQLSDMFAVSGHRSWYPLSHIAALPREMRRETLLEAAVSAGRLRRSPTPDELTKQRRNRWLTLFVVAAAWISIVLVASYVNYAPFNANGFVRFGVFPALGGLAICSLPSVVRLFGRISVGK